MESLRLCLVQWPQIWENPEKTRTLLEDLLAGIKPGSADIIILPEMWSTGFSMNTAALAEPMDGASVRWMQEQAARLDAAVAGSLMIVEDGKHCNRLIFAEPSGQLHHYDKKHVFGLADEHLHFTPGREKKIIGFRGWSICPMICYDLRFPAWSRNLEDYDLLLYVAQFPQKRSLAWNSLLRARAIENVCYLAGVNGLGTDGNGITYQGDSSVIDYEGKDLLLMGSEPGCRMVEINRHPLAAFRRAYPFLRDRDNFYIS